MLIPKVSLNNTQNQTTFGNYRNVGSIPSNRRDFLAFINVLKPYPELAEQAMAILTQRGHVKRRTISEQFATLMLAASRVKASRASAPIEARIVASRFGEEI